MIRCLSRLLVSTLLLTGGVFGAYAASSCPGDLNNDGEVTVDEIVRAVGAALDGCPPQSALSALLQTGQTQCDPGSGQLGACAGASPAGQDGALQVGMPASYTDNNDGTVHDNVSGLTWEKLSDDGSIHDWDNQYTWQQAFDMKIAALDAAPCFAGHCDWRLPNRRELESLVNAGVDSPAVDGVFNIGCLPGCHVADCSCTQLDNYWTSTTYHAIPGSAWCVNGGTGTVDGFDKTIPAFYVRAVRGGR